VARILISLNIQEGLQEFLNLTDLGRTRVQILDYEGVPFHVGYSMSMGILSRNVRNSRGGTRAVNIRRE
jgi:hypothetical protein